MHETSLTNIDGEWKRCERASVPTKKGRMIYTPALHLYYIKHKKYRSDYSVNMEDPIDLDRRTPLALAHLEDKIEVISWKRTASFQSTSSLDRLDYSLDSLF